MSAQLPSGVAAFLEKPAQQMVMGEERGNSSSVSQLNGILTWNGLPTT